MTSLSFILPLPVFLLPSCHLVFLPTLFQMFEDWFSGSGPDGSGLSSELSSDLGSGFSSGVRSESSFASGSGLDFGSAWGSGEVHCPGLLGKPANYQKAELQSEA